MNGRPVAYKLTLCTDIHTSGTYIPTYIHSFVPTSYVHQHTIARTIGDQDEEMHGSKKTVGYLRVNAEQKKPPRDCIPLSVPFLLTTYKVQSTIPAVQGDNV